MYAPRLFIHLYVRSLQAPSSSRWMQSRSVPLAEAPGPDWSLWRVRALGPSLFDNIAQVVLALSAQHAPTFLFFPQRQLLQKSNKILTVFIFMDTIAQRTVLYIYLSLMFYQPLCWASLLAFPENACPMVLVPKQKVCVS